MWNGARSRMWGEIQTRGISEVWPGLWIGLHCRSVVQRPLPSWKATGHLTWTSKVPEAGGRVEVHRRLSPSLSATVKWWLVSRNRWFHFPAGLGNCPHCSKYQYLMEGPCYPSASLASKLLQPLRESLDYCEEKRFETPDPTMQKSRRSLSEQPGPTAPASPPPGQADSHAGYVLTLFLNGNHKYFFLS